MQELQYSQPPAKTATDVVLLCALPCAAGALGLLTRMLGVAEPFMVLKARDAAVFFGAPIAIVVLGLVWWRLVLKGRLRWLVIVPVLAWFALCTFGATEELLLYLREPWTRSRCWITTRCSGPDGHRGPRESNAGRPPGR